MDASPTIYNPIKDRAFDDSRCFLCGIALTEDNRTQEHIFPKWLLNQYNLWDERLILLNKQSLPYRQIKIPCCKQCNNVHLGGLERKVKEAVAGGYKKFKFLSRKTLFLWILKIFYQIIFMELRLYFDVKYRSKGMILPKEDLDRFTTCHICLQATRMKTKFNNPVPWSIFIFKLQKHKEKSWNFDFRDNLVNFNLAIRMGDIGIISCLLDNHTQYECFASYFRKFRTLQLHPIQFAELIAKVFYKSNLLNRTPKYITATSPDIMSIVSLPLAGFSRKPIYDDWIQADYARWLSFMCNVEYDFCYEPQTDRVWSFLQTESGDLNFMDINNKGRRPE